MMDAPSSATAPSAEALQQHALENGFVAREAWAFEAAYKTYRSLLYGAAYGVLRDASDAEDCVHDVLARLWQHGHAYNRARGSLHAFLTVCVRNEALSRARQSANRSRILREAPPPDLTEPAPDSSLVDRVDIAKVLRGLTDSQREAIRLAYYEGLTHEQIAARLSEPVGTIKSRLSSALRVLRRLLSSGTTP